MNTTATVKVPKSDSGIIGWITQYDSLVVFGGLGLVVFLTVLYTGLFQAGPITRPDVLFNAALAILMAFGFVYVIFVFIGQKIVIFGKAFDIGMVIYIFIVCFVMFILGN
jgi:hypothetical protein